MPDTKRCVEKCVLSLALKISNDSASLTKSGKEFQIDGPATATECVLRTEFSLLEQPSRVEKKPRISARSDARQQNRAMYEEAIPCSALYTALHTWNGHNFALVASAIYLWWDLWHGRIGGDRIWVVLQSLVLPAYNWFYTPARRLKCCCNTQLARWWHCSRVGLL